VPVAGLCAAHDKFCQRTFGAHSAGRRRIYGTRLTIPTNSSVTKSVYQLTISPGKSAGLRIAASRKRAWQRVLSEVHDGGAPVRLLADCLAEAMSPRDAALLLSTEAGTLALRGCVGLACAGAHEQLPLNGPLARLLGRRAHSIAVATLRQCLADEDPSEGERVWLNAAYAQPFYADDPQRRTAGTADHGREESRRGL
jgi:hypothetical protein